MAMLACLCSAVSQACYVHRDLRWENCACDLSWRYFLLDLELCAPAGQQPSFRLVGWSDDALVAGCYTPASDLHQLGLLLQSVLPAGTLSTEARAFLAALAWPAATLEQQQRTAHTLLQSPWIGCAGEHCGAAGAHPDDR
jgi:hypothetical protein